MQFNPFALGKAKIVYNFGLCECKRVKLHTILAFASAKGLNHTILAFASAKGLNCIQFWPFRVQKG